MPRKLNLTLNKSGRRKQKYSFIKHLNNMIENCTIEKEVEKDASQIKRLMLN
jgi:hypothetical protein